MLHQHQQAAQKDAEDGPINTKKALIVRDPRDFHSANIASMVENAQRGGKQRDDKRRRLAKAVTINK
jgi:short subunit dehydrogenase-like uncharacterized protein